MTGIGGRKHFWDPGLPVVHALVPTARSSRELRAAKRVVAWVESQRQQKVFPARDRERRRVREKLRVKLWNFKRLGYVSLEEQAQRNNFKNPTKQESGDDQMIVYAKKFMIGADRAATGSTRCGWSAGRCCTRRSTTLGFAWILRSEEYNDASSYGQEENEEVIEDGS